MNNVTAIQVLFGQNVPAGADFEGAFNALKGKKDDDLSSADVAALDELAEAFQDFVSDQTGWIKKVSKSDPRYSWWVQLAQALGASVEPTSDPHVTEPEHGIDPDAFAGGALPPSRREGGGGTGGGGFSIRTDDSDDEERLRRERKKRTDRRDSNEDEDGRHRERQEREPPEPPPRPKPLIDVTDRSIPAITREILAYSSYKNWSSWLIEAFRLIRSGTSREQVAKRAALPHMYNLIRSMEVSNSSMEVHAGFHLERLLEVLEAGRDQREPAWFQANYVTGSYD